jgi:hypothetical protein
MIRISLTGKLKFKYLKDERGIYHVSGKNSDRKFRRRACES